MGRFFHGDTFIVAATCVTCTYLITQKNQNIEVKPMPVIARKVASVAQPAIMPDIDDQFQNPELIQPRNNLVSYELKAREHFENVIGESDAECKPALDKKLFQMFPLKTELGLKEAYKSFDHRGLEIRHQMIEKWVGVQSDTASPLSQEKCNFLSQKQKLDHQCGDVLEPFQSILSNVSAVKKANLNDETETAEFCKTWVREAQKICSTPGAANKSSTAAATLGKPKYVSMQINSPATRLNDIRDYLRANCTFLVEPSRQMMAEQPIEEEAPVVQEKQQRGIASIQGKEGSFETVEDLKDGFSLVETEPSFETEEVGSVAGSQ